MMSSMYSTTGLVGLTVPLPKELGDEEVNEFDLSSGRRYTHVSTKIQTLAP